MNKDSQNLLIATYQNTSTAIQSIENCIDDIGKEEFVNELKEEIEGYKKINDECEKLAKDHGVDLKDNNIFEKIRLWSSIKINTIIDKSPRHYAEIFFIGSNMGVFNMICAICDNKQADKNTVDLAQKLLQLEENYVMEIKKYFCDK